MSLTVHLTRKHVQSCSNSLLLTCVWFMAKYNQRGNLHHKGETHICLEKKKIIYISPSCLPVTLTTIELRYLWPGAALVFIFNKFHEFVGPEQEEQEVKLASTEVQFGSVASESYVYLRALSDILSYSSLKADTGLLFSRYPRRGLPSLNWEGRRAGRSEGQNSWRFPSIKLLKVERSAVSQCSPWEALPCFLSLTQLCNGKSICLYSLFVFGSKPCPVFVHTGMHFSWFHSILFVCFSCSIVISESTQLRY